MVFSIGILLSYQDNYMEEGITFSAIKTEFRIKELTDFRCKKNQKHKCFIPVHRFTTSHLPDRLKDETVVDLIKAISDLTVRVCVSKSSETAAPPYPKSIYYKSHECFEFSNKSVGSGIVISVKHVTDESYTCENCNCYKCKCMSSPKQVKGEIFVLTSSFLICDEEQAKQSSFTFFYDKITSFTKIEDGFKATCNGLDNGCSLVEIRTHDDNLLKKLKESLQNLEGKLSVVNRKYSSEFNDHKMAIIVSYPHDCPKHVTVGTWTDKRDDESYYRYTTATCQGSVGAFVYLFGLSDLKKYYVHCGNTDWEINFSSSCYEKTISNESEDVSNDAQHKEFSDLRSLDKGGEHCNII